MAPNAGVVPNELPLPVHRPQTPQALIPSDDTARLPKRRRESESPTSRSLTSEQLDSFGSPTKSARLSFSTNQSFPSLTGAAALEEERRRKEEDEEQELASPGATSDNPSHQALLSLMPGGTQAMSRQADAPQVAPTATMEPEAKVAIAVLSMPPDGDQAEEQTEIGVHSPASIADAPVTESPSAMEGDDKGDSIVLQQVAVQEDRHQQVSLSYPGSLQSNINIAEQPARGMSFPIPSQTQTSPSSAGGKKHKCPYCSTEFTRHHNLKSHLLTHSQEKPYVCTDCQMRFRRLHDLKRHGKLHTGEKPHVCPKCDRKFARGDALARHSKGAGGCAGRRSSMGSFADGEDLDVSIGGEGDDTTMSGIAYDAGEDEELRRQSLPALGTQHIAAGSVEPFGGHGRTYPPAGSRGVNSGLYAPNIGQTQTASTNSPTASSSLSSAHAAGTIIGPVSASTGTPGMVFSQTGVADNTRQSSPGLVTQDTTNITRQRSPSLTSQHQQQQQPARRQTELQSPRNGQARPKIPGLSHPGYVASSTTTSYNTHGKDQSGGTSNSDSGNMFAQSDPSVWAYIQTLEDKVKTLSEKVSGLDQEMAELKRQLGTRQENNITAG